MSGQYVPYDYDPDSGPFAGPPASPPANPPANPPMRAFSTGATRDVDDTKLHFRGYLSPLVLTRYAEYMRYHQQTPGGPRAPDNWQKGIPQQEYVESLLRHVITVWTLHCEGVGEVYSVEMDQMEEALCGVLFNTMGLLFELLMVSSGRREQ